MAELQISMRLFQEPGRTCALWQVTTFSWEFRRRRTCTISRAWSISYVFAGSCSRNTKYEKADYSRCGDQRGARVTRAHATRARGGDRCEGQPRRLHRKQSAQTFVAAAPKARL